MQQVRYKVLKQGQPYKALDSRMTTNLLSKADYKGLKEDEVDLGTQRLKGTVDLNGTQSSIEPWT